MQSYSELFEQRGSSYDQAMLAFPEARRQEFAQVLDAAPARLGMKAGDVPAGGGYMRGFLPEGVEWFGHEPCASFTNHGDVVADAPSKPLLPLPWPDRYLDVVYSLAGVHHLEDKTALFREIYRVTRPEGRFALSDVAEGSKVSRFLDDFVGRWNSTGHEGVYLGAATLRELADAGWQVETSGINDFLWRFANRQDMAAFCGKLFDIGGIEAEGIIEAIETMLGTEALPDGGIGMRWSLMTVVSSPA